MCRRRDTDSLLTSPVGIRVVKNIVEMRQECINILLDFGFVFLEGRLVLVIIQREADFGFVIAMEATKGFKEGLERFALESDPSCMKPPEFDVAADKCSTAVFVDVVIDFVKYSHVEEAGILKAMNGDKEEDPQKGLEIIKDVVWFGIGS